MSLPKRAFAILCNELPLAFDFNLSADPPFWHDILARLQSYHRQACGLPATHEHNHRKYDTIKAIRNSLHPCPPAMAPTISYAAAQNIAARICGFTWAETKETSDLWIPLQEYFAHYLPRSIPPKQKYSVALRFDSEKPLANPVSYIAEEQKLIACNLRPAPFREEYFYVPGKLPHHDPNDPTLLRYIPQTKPFKIKSAITCKPGKFLERFYGDKLSTTQIADFAAKFRVEGLPPELLLARTADEIDFVYRNGPTSCMSSGNADINGQSPVRSYAGPDLAVAYLKKEGAINARALVWPEKKVASRIYGDYEALSKALIGKGYKLTYSPDKCTIDREAFVGARMQPLIAADWRPANLKYDQKGEPILILPFGDSNDSGYFDRDSGFFILGETPANAIKHTLCGGFSLHAIPRDPDAFPLQILSYNKPAMRVHIGSSGNNTNQTDSISAYHYTIDDLPPKARTTYDAHQEQVRKAREAAIEAAKRAQERHKRAMAKILAQQPAARAGNL